jgi:hypothetical protein
MPLRQIDEHDNMPVPSLVSIIDAPSEQALRQTRYLENKGTKCPHCSSGDIEDRSVDIGQGTANQEMSCGRCYAVWADVYKLTHIVEIEPPDQRMIDEDQEEENGDE